MSEIFLAKNRTACSRGPTATQGTGGVPGRIHSNVPMGNDTVFEEIKFVFVNKCPVNITGFGFPTESLLFCTHGCIDPFINYAIIGSNNGLSPVLAPSRYPNRWWYNECVEPLATITKIFIQGNVNFKSSGFIVLSIEVPVVSHTVPDRGHLCACRWPNTVRC